MGAPILPMVAVLVWPLTNQFCSLLPIRILTASYREMLVECGSSQFTALMALTVLMPLIPAVTVSTVSSSNSSLT